MILKTFRVTNVGVFRGEHTFDLTSRGSRSIVLIGGKNGAGKSTLFEAIRLCLYGAKVNGPLTQAQYAAYLDEKIHSSQHLLVQPGFASVALVVDVSEYGRVRTYELTRSWTRSNGALGSETFELTRDGVPVDEIENQHWGEFVEDLVPRGIADLFFFDGERIQRLARDSTDTVELHDAIKSLLGLHLVERLNADLNIYLTKATRHVRRKDPKDRTEGLQAELREASQELDATAAAERDAQAVVLELRESIGRVASQLTAEGGTLAKDRDALTERRATLIARIQRDEDTVREAASGLFPFAVVPDLCLQLRASLAAEEAALENRAAEARLARAKDELLGAVHDDGFLDSVKGLSKRATTRVREELDGVIARTFAPSAGSCDIVHDLSPSKRARLGEWIREATNEIPVSMQAVAKRLDEEYRELQRIERRLKKVPEEGVVAPLVARLEEHHEQLERATRRGDELHRQLQALQSRHERLKRDYATELDRLATADAAKATTRLIPRLRTVLDDYQTALLKRKTRELAREATQCFELLSRKKDRIGSIEIAPDDLAVTLRDHKEREIEKAHLSAGEKQMYAVAMLWALARTSGRPLPVIIDTPMARLDSDHRTLFLNDYLPAASHQVIVLSTDKEVDAEAFTELKPHIARSYHLGYDDGDGATHVQRGYFW